MIQGFCAARVVLPKELELRHLLIKSRPYYVDVAMWRSHHIILLSVTTQLNSMTGSDDTVKYFDNSLATLHSVIILF